MTPFTTLHAVAAPMADADVDTDVIFPARFLLITEKVGLGRYAFHDKRYTPEGAERPTFVLNQAPWRDAGILVAGVNFGCGSSREQAPWALADLGLRCIVAPSFGEIFQANCYANGVLPVTVPAAHHARLLAEADAARPMLVDLMACCIELERGTPIAFVVPERERRLLLAGLDEIGLVLRDDEERIASFERAQQDRQPWLHAASNDRAERP